MVGVLGFEPRTSSLSGTRSNQLSYTPGFPQKRPPFGHGPRVRSNFRPAAGRFRGCPRSPFVRAAYAVLRTSSMVFLPLNNPSHQPRPFVKMVELTGIEPVTYSLQSYRSSQLSYSPRSIGSYPVFFCLTFNQLRLRAVLFKL